MLIDEGVKLTDKLFKPGAVEWSVRIPQKEPQVVLVVDRYLDIADPDNRFTQPTHPGQAVGFYRLRCIVGDQEKDEVCLGCGSECKFFVGLAFEGRNPRHIGHLKAIPAVAANVACRALGTSSDRLAITASQYLHQGRLARQGSPEQRDRELIKPLTAFLHHGSHRQLQLPRLVNDVAEVPFDLFDNGRRPNRPVLERLQTLRQRL